MRLGRPNSRSDEPRARRPQVRPAVALSQVGDIVRYDTPDRTYSIEFKGNAMNRALGLALLSLAFASAASAKDLVGVFEDALRNDPQIRQADANRLASREARPQAWSALLPQLSATASQTRDHSAGFADQIQFPVVNLGRICCHHGRN